MGSATEITPTASPSTARKTGVSPSAANSVAHCDRSLSSTPSLSSRRRLPSNTSRPSILARTPYPASASKASTTRERSSFCSCAAATIAAARGCSDPISISAAIWSRCVSSHPGIGINVVTVGRPAVTVPVLSSTTQSSCPTRCSASPLRIKIPNSAALPTATIIDIGVANPSAQGQAIINTVIVVTKTNADFGSGPKLNQTMKVITAMTSTTGTKIAATRSTNRAIAGLVLCA